MTTNSTKRKPSYQQALALEKAQKAAAAARRRRRAASEDAPSDMDDFCKECGGWEGRHSNVCPNRPRN